MKPRFALSLSVDGIQLLHRAAGGWRLVGDVGLDTADLAGDLATLRKTATTLEPAGIHCKLIIPNDQIRYLSVPLDDHPPEHHDDLARAALDGATPYDVGDLAYDTSASDTDLHIAAVARETLAEAEAFALEHRFNPVSFVAIPGEEPFLGEPWFGTSSDFEAKRDDGVDVEPDGVAVVIIGQIEPPDGPVVNVADGAPAVAEIETPPREAPEDPSEPPKATPEPEPAVAPKSETPPETEPEPDLTPEKVAPMVGFASRRGRGNAAPSLGGARRGNDTPVAPDIPIPASEIPTPPVVERPPKSQPDAAAARQLMEERMAERAAAQKEQQPAPKRTLLRGAKAGAAAAVAMKADASESQRMTIFGARDASAVGGKPRYLGVVLTVILLVFLAGVAAWASVFLDDGIAGLFKREERPTIVAAPVPAEQPSPEVLSAIEPTLAPDEPEAIEQPITLAAADPGEAVLSDTDNAVLDALREPVDPADEQSGFDTAPLTPEEAEVRYAVTGIWQMAPEVPSAPALIDLEDIYIASIDPRTDMQDAVALAQPEAFDTDQSAPVVNSPAAAGTTFALDDQGLVVPTPEGALSPDGVLVFAGRPPKTPPPTPNRADADALPEAATAELALKRPKARPGGLVENNERTQLGGLTRAELAGLRPRLRPQVEKIEEERDETPTAQAVAASRKPSVRPVNFAAVVQKAQRQPQPSAGGVTQAFAVAPRTVTPKIPSSASVARRATIENAINLRKVNLIGVYGTPSSRRALVRLSNGSYKKVKVGDRIDGGRVSAIGDSELRYQKSGRNVVLKMPKG